MEKFAISQITMQLTVDKYIKLALEEDINGEDLSTNAVTTPNSKATAELICKEDGIVAGLDVFSRVFSLLDSATIVDFCASDGNHVIKGNKIATITGHTRTILSAERTALNYLQRLSGIATYTKEMTDLLVGSKIKLLDTRKTTPCMRTLEKYAVRVGGGCNHRYNLTDGILLKDNHIDAAGSVTAAINAARAYAPFVHKIEVEVENMSMVREAIAAKADIIMLDNMTVAQMKEAITYIDGRAKTECSGNVTLENISKLRLVGVDYISSGALTHSAPALDFSLKHVHII